MHSAVVDRRRDESTVWSSLFPIRASRFINIVDKSGIDLNNVVLDKDKVLTQENARVFLSVNLCIADLVLMSEQKVVQPSVRERFSQGTWDLFHHPKSFR
jgi:hypothetical protein